MAPWTILDHGAFPEEPPIENPEKPGCVCLAPAGFPLLPLPLLHQSPDRHGQPVDLLVCHFSALGAPQAGQNPCDCAPPLAAEASWRIEAPGASTGTAMAWVPAE